MIYKDAITQAMDNLAKDPKTIFIGYNVRCGSQANGTLKNVPAKQLLETPVAENLMAGLATGLSLRGYLPLVYFERFDFMLNALDCIVNHIDKMKEMSQGQFAPVVIMRALVGSRKNPLYTGSTHTQDFTAAISEMVSFPVVSYKEKDNVIDLWKECVQEALATRTSLLMVEHRDSYNMEVPYGSKQVQSQ